jgi:hypothetical protein
MSIFAPLACEFKRHTPVSPCGENSIMLAKTLIVSSNATKDGRVIVSGAFNFSRSMSLWCNLVAG